MREGWGTSRVFFVILFSLFRSIKKSLRALGGWKITLKARTFSTSYETWDDNEISSLRRNDTRVVCAMMLTLTRFLFVDVCDDNEQPLGHNNKALINFKMCLNCCFMFMCVELYWIRKFNSLSIENQRFYFLGSIWGLWHSNWVFAQRTCWYFCRYRSLIDRCWNKNSVLLSAITHCSLFVNPNNTQRDLSTASFRVLFNWKFQASRGCLCDMQLPMWRGQVWSEIFCLSGILSELFTLERTNASMYVHQIRVSEHILIILHTF